MGGRPSIPVYLRGLQRCSRVRSTTALQQCKGDGHRYHGWAGRSTPCVFRRPQPASPCPQPASPCPQSASPCLSELPLCSVPSHPPCPTSPGLGSPLVTFPRLLLAVPPAGRARGGGLRGRRVLRAGHAVGAGHDGPDALDGQHRTGAVCWLASRCMISVPLCPRARGATREARRLNVSLYDGCSIRWMFYSIPTGQQVDSPNGVIKLAHVSLLQPCDTCSHRICCCRRICCWRFLPSGVALLAVPCFSPAHNAFFEPCPCCSAQLRAACWRRMRWVGRGSSMQHGLQFDEGASPHA